MERLNYGLTAGYEFSLFKNTGIELRYLYGLSDQTKSEFYGDSGNHITNDFQFSIKYNIFNNP